MKPQLDVQVAVPEATASPVYENMLGRWGSVQYPQLSIIVAYLRFVALVHQTNHWQARGDSFYGDHKLFEELYSQTNENVDEVAEHAVGLGDTNNVTLPAQLLTISELCAGSNSPTVPQAADLARSSLAAEVNFLRCLKAMISSLTEMGTMTDGLFDLLGGVANQHEKHVYKLKQRCR